MGRWNVGLVNGWTLLFRCHSFLLSGISFVFFQFSEKKKEKKSSNAGKLYCPP